jgi:hypothetical protein
VGRHRKGHADPEDARSKAWSDADYAAAKLIAPKREEFTSPEFLDATADDIVEAYDLTLSTAYALIHLAIGLRLGRLNEQAADVMPVAVGAGRRGTAPIMPRTEGTTMTEHPELRLLFDEGRRRRPMRRWSPRKPPRWPPWSPTWGGGSKC